MVPQCPLRVHMHIHMNIRWASERVGTRGGKRVSQHNEWVQQQIMKANSWDSLHQTIVAFAGRAGKYRLDLETLTLLLARVNRAIVHSSPNESQVSSLSVLLTRLEKTLYERYKQQKEPPNPRIVAALSHALVTVSRVKKIPPTLLPLVEKHIEWTMLNMPVPSLVRAVGALGHFGMLRGNVATQLSRLLELKPVQREMSKIELLYLCEAAAQSGCQEKGLWKCLRNASLQEPQEHDEHTLPRLAKCFAVANQYSENILDMVDKEGARFVTRMPHGHIGDILRFFSAFSYDSSHFLPAVKRKLEKEQLFEKLADESHLEEFHGLLKMSMALLQHDCYHEKISKWFSHLLKEFPYLLDRHTIANALTIASSSYLDEDVPKLIYEEFKSNIQYLGELTVCKALWVFSQVDLISVHLLDLICNRLMLLKKSTDIQTSLKSLGHLSKWFLLFPVLANPELSQSTFGKIILRTLGDEDFTRLYYSSEQPEVEHLKSNLKQFCAREDLYSGRLLHGSVSSLYEIPIKHFENSLGLVPPDSSFEKVVILPIFSTTLELKSSLHRKILERSIAKHDLMLPILVEPKSDISLNPAKVIREKMSTWKGK